MLRAQSLRPKISWIRTMTGAFWLTSGYTTNTCTVRPSCVSFTHSWWRGDLLSIAFAQSCARAEDAVKAQQRTSRQNDSAVDKGSRFFMRESIAEKAGNKGARE